MLRTVLRLLPVSALAVVVLILPFPGTAVAQGAVSASGAMPIPVAEDGVVEPPWADAPGVLFDINVHTREELELVLRRVEALVQGGAETAPPNRIALVLHGPEVAFFAARNYPDYHELVDLAAKLSAFEIIEIKMCRTQMQNLGIEASEVPPFIELVPFGPAEVERLQAESYVVM